ncbi:MAG: PKD repeat protein [Bacteroidia bacterium]|jgi:PKD repeat protein
MPFSLLKMFHLIRGFAFAILACCSVSSLACTGITVKFNATQSGSCIPKTVTIQNNSTGTLASTAIYQLYVNGALMDTAHGLSKTFSLNLSRGTYAIKLKSIDNSSCIDSTQKNINITKASWEFTGNPGSYSTTPEWINCIQQSTDPDSFIVATKSKDSLAAVRIIWGDGTGTNITNLKKDSVIKHLFVLTGTFTTLIITTDTGGCTDTTIGTIINERIPTAGIVGPNSGFNVGCAPFSIKFVNNSSNISNGTKFTWDLGDGTTVEKDNSTFNQAFFYTYTGTLCSGTVRLIASNACGSSQTTWNPIQVSKPDRAIFTLDSTNCDSVGDFTFTNLSADSFCIFPDTKEYYWDFGDSTNSGWITSKGPVFHNYKDEGPKTVCLITKNKCGNDTSCIPTTVIYTPIVGFEIDTLLGCGSATVHVKDSSIGYGLTRLWQWGDGTSSSGLIDSHTYVGRGTYNLKFTVANRCGSNSLTRQVVIKDKPTASFSGLTNGCVIHTINLKNNATTDFDSSAIYRWNFGNGDSSFNGAPPTVPYSDSGTFDIRLIVSDTCGADTQMQSIRVDLLPTIQMTADSALCSLDTVQFNNTSTNFDFLILDYGDGSTNDSIFNLGLFNHVYTDSGTYAVVIRAVNELICETYDTLIVIIKPNSQSVISLTDTAACAPFTFKFQNKSKFSSSYKWFINDTFISNQTQLDSLVIVQDSVLKRIMLIAIDTIGCKTDTAEQLVFTGKNPVAAFVSTIDSGCSPLTDTLLNTSTFGETYKWDLGNGNQSTLVHPASTFVSAARGDTSYQIRLVVSTWLGCVDTTYGTRKVFPIPISAFTMDTSNGCYPVNVNFTNQSDPNGLGNLSDMRFAWDFDNGTTDTVLHPSGITFTDSKTIDTTYIVKLSVTSTNGCPAESFDTVTVYPKPSIDFSISEPTGCGPLSVNFQNNSLPNNKGSINLMSFVWDLGDGQTSIIQNPVNSYLASLSRDTFYTVRVIGISEHQCVDSTEKVIQVYPKPLAKFSLDKDAGCSPLEVQFDNLSTPYDTSTIANMTFEWTYGNGFSSSNQQDTTTYNEANFADSMYIIQLIAISEHQCKDTFSDSVTVYPTPSSEFTTSDSAGCGPLQVDFTNLSTLNDTNYWDLGSGFSVSPADTQFTFPFVLLKDTTYQIRLNTKSSNGCISDTALQVVTVWSYPIANFTVGDDSICFYDSFYFTNNSLGATAYEWNFDDGATSVTTSPAHQYAKGTDAFKDLNFTVRLEATTAKGCKDTVYETVNVHPFTVAEIGNAIDSFCSPTTINFTNISSNHTSSFWDFGGGNTSNQTQPSFFYQNISNVTRNLMVTLHTENDFGCVDDDTLKFKIMPEPIADFSPFRLDVCDSGYHTLVNRSINNTVNEWTFGDGSVSTLPEPYHLFERNRLAPATYTVQLIVKNQAGCPDTAAHTIVLNPIHTVDFDTSLIRSVCVGDPIQFNNRSSFAAYHKWLFGDGGESRDSLPNYFYGAAGLFDVKYIGYDLNGCPDSVTKKAMVQVFDRPQADFNFNPTNPKMPNSLVNFTDNSTPSSGLVYAWDFDDAGKSSVVQNPSHTFLDSGFYDVTFIIDNGFCRDTITKPLYVAPPLPIPDFMVNDTAGCGPFDVQFTAQSLHANSYRWFFDDGSESSEENPLHTFVFEGYYDIGLVTYGPGGQADTTFNKLIRVYPKPTAYFTVSNTEQYLPNPIFTPSNESVDASSYQWYLIDENDQNVGASVDAFPQITVTAVGVYSLELQAINTFGCRDTFIRPLYLTVKDSGYIYIPTAFTPTKSPGLNDIFKPTMEGVDPDGYLFQVYNRWGEHIFETSDVNGYWDGFYQNQMSEMEQYIFIVSGRFYSGQVFEEKGTVLLMR